MTFAAPTVEELQARVFARVGRFLKDTGIYAPESGGAVPAIREGIARGLRVVGVASPSALVVDDDDLLNLTAFSQVRVEDEAAYWCLSQADLNWYRAMEKHLEPVAPAPMTGGWLAEQRRSLRAEIARLQAIVDEPYREPSAPMVIADRDPSLDLRFPPYPFGLGCPGDWGTW